MDDCIPVYEPGGTVTARASIAITGKRFVAVSGEPQGDLLGLDDDADGGNIQVAYPAAGGEILGVSNRTVADEGKVGVLGTPGLYVPVTASEAVAAGNQIGTTNDGKAKVADAGENAVALCIQGAGIGEDAVVRIYGAPVPIAAP